MSKYIGKSAKVYEKLEAGLGKKPSRYLGDTAQAYETLEADFQRASQVLETSVCQVDECLVGMVAGATCTKESLGATVRGECRMDAEATLGLRTSTRGRSSR